MSEPCDLALPTGYTDLLGQAQGQVQSRTNQGSADYQHQLIELYLAAQTYDGLPPAGQKGHRGRAGAPGCRRRPGKFPGSARRPRRLRARLPGWPNRHCRACRGPRAGLRPPDHSRRSPAATGCCRTRRRPTRKVWSRGRTPESREQPRRGSERWSCRRDVVAVCPAPDGPFGLDDDQHR